MLAPARIELSGVAPDNGEFGVMLPYTPLHHLLFAAGAPDVLVMTSANRSSEPIAYEDEDALERLSGIADAFLIGRRPIARRVDDSVVRAGAFGPPCSFGGAGLCSRRRGHSSREPSDSGSGRGFEEYDHSRGGRSGLCQPAHRRPGSLPVIAGISRNYPRSGVDVRGSLG